MYASLRCLTPSAKTSTPIQCEEMLFNEYSSVISDHTNRKQLQPSLLSFKWSEKHKGLWITWLSATNKLGFNTHFQHHILGASGAWVN